MVNKNACGLEMGEESCFFTRSQITVAVKRSGAVSPLSARIGKSLVIVTTGKKTKQNNQKRGGKKNAKRQAKGAVVTAGGSTRRNLAVATLA